MVRPLPTPEQLLDYSEEPPLALELKCNCCGRRQSRKFEWACIDPRHDPRNEEWDGILLSRIVECAGCCAVDDYTLGGGSFLRLTGGLLRSLGGESGKGRIIVGVSQLWDGSIARRPSEALARLRHLTVEHPNRAEAFRRLGNGCERWGLMEEAITSWKKALELDPAEVEAAYSLAAHWWGPGDRPLEGLEYLRRGLQAIPRAAELKREVGPWGAGLVQLLQDVVDGCEEPLALMAAWSGGEVNGEPVLIVSSVDLRKVDDLQRLADFFARPGLLSLDLTSELPEEEPTNLQRVLSGDAPLQQARFPGASPSEPRRSPGRVGRNAPCPCGSGKKHKRCCGS
jgi:hypothetical protein